MRKILKYIGILLIINWGFDLFAVESSQEITFLQEFDKNCNLAFGTELERIFTIIGKKTPEENNEKHMKNLQNQMDLLESQFRDGSLYDRSDIVSTALFFEDFLMRDANNKPIKNYINGCKILTSMMVDLDLQHNWSAFTYLSQRYSDSYGPIKNFSLQYKNLYMQSFTTPDKSRLINKFSDLFDKICSEEAYFKDLFQPCFQAIKDDNLDEALTQMVLKFTFLNDLLGEGSFGIPHYFNTHLKKVDVGNSIEIQSTDPTQLKLLNTYKNLSFNLIDIIHRIGFLKLFQQTINDFQSSRNFQNWINHNDNWTKYVSFFCFFLQLVLRDMDLFVVVPGLESLRNYEETRIISLIRKIQLLLTTITNEISYGLSKDLIQQSNYQLEKFDDVMDSFLYLFNTSFKRYFIQKFLKPSKEELEIMDLDVTKKIHHRKTTNLTPFEKSSLELSDRLNATLKFCLNRPLSKDNIEENLMFLIGIKRQVFQITNDFIRSIRNMTRKYITKNNDVKIFNSTAWMVFLTQLNPENKNLYVQYLKANENFKKNFLNELTEKNKKYLAIYNEHHINDFYNEEEMLDTIVKEEAKKAPVQDFSQKNLKKMSEATSKQYKKASKTTKEKSSTSVKEEESMALNQSERIKLETREKFYDVCQDKLNCYTSYKSALKIFNNNLNNCINLMEIPIINGKNPLNSLIKKLQSLGIETEALEKIKDKINNAKNYEDNRDLVQLEDSYNFDQINKLIKKENEKVEKFNTMISLLGIASSHLNEVMVHWAQENIEEQDKVVVFATKTQSLFSRPMESQPIYQPEHIANPKGELGQEGPTARLKKKKRKNEEVQIAFQDAVDQEKEMEEAIKQVEKEQEEGRNEGDKILKEERAKKNKEYIEKIVKQIQANIYYKKNS
jgi:hypothetical protein